MNCVAAQQGGKGVLATVEVKMLNIGWCFKKKNSLGVALGRWFSRLNVCHTNVRA